jgi:hypothetical protein
MAPRNVRLAAAVFILNDLSNACFQPRVVDYQYRADPAASVQAVGDPRRQPAGLGDRARRINQCHRSHVRRHLEHGTYNRLDDTLGLSAPALGDHCRAGDRHKAVRDFHNHRRALRVARACLGQQPGPRPRHHLTREYLCRRAGHIDARRRPPRRVNDDHTFRASAVQGPQHHSPQRGDSDRTQVDQGYRIVDAVERGPNHLIVSDCISAAT